MKAENKLLARTHAIKKAMEWRREQRGDNRIVLNIHIWNLTKEHQMLDGYLVTGIEHLIYDEMELPSDKFEAANWEGLKQELLKLNNCDVSDMVQPDGFLNHVEGKRLVRPMLAAIKRELQRVGFTFKDE